ncbi:MAG TPA: hypothetical protein VH042_01415 [Solirubrobacterales bacterium]|jgi:hypothetical protein|nr:hypothetical protein [Solirubrobacterales bacterium]
MKRQAEAQGRTYPSRRTGSAAAFLAVVLTLAIAVLPAASAQAAISATAAPIGSANSGSYLVTITNEGQKSESPPTIVTLIELSSGEAATGIVPGECHYGQPVAGTVIGCSVGLGAKLQVCYNGPAPSAVSEFGYDMQHVQLSLAGPVAACPVSGFVPRSSGGASGGGGAGDVGSSGDAKPLTLGKITDHAKKGTATLNVTVPGPGSVKLSGQGVKGQTAKAKGAGQVSLTVKAKGNSAATLAKTGKVTLHVSVTFTPSGGSATTLKKNVKLLKN